MAAQYLLLFVLAAVMGFMVVIWQLPGFIMGKLMDRVAQSSQDGRLAPPLPDDKARGVVLPSPDLAYVLCSYDLGKGALTVTLDPPPLPYWSVAAYADNTDNFLVINDRDPRGTHSFTLVPPGAPANSTDKGRVVAAPSARGLILFRGLMAERNDSLLKQTQASVSCRHGA